MSLPTTSHLYISESLFLMEECRTILHNAEEEVRKGSLRMKYEPNSNAKLLKEQISEQHCRAKELWVCLDETTPLFTTVCVCGCSSK